MVSSRKRRGSYNNFSIICFFILFDRTLSALCCEFVSLVFNYNISTMLLSSMNNKEIRKEVLNDFEIITNSSTIDRFATDYYRERKKLSIDREDSYPLFYEIKTKAKNNWMFMLTKLPYIHKYSSKYDFSILCFLYYYTSKGICVIQINQTKNIFVYYGHLFSRYRERMNLDIPNLLDVVILYFAMNETPTYKFLPKKDEVIQAIGVVNEGFLKGEYDEEAQLCINKTFINLETASETSLAYVTQMLSDATDYLINSSKEYSDETQRRIRNLYKSFYAPVETENWKEKGASFKLPELNRKPEPKTESDFMAFLKREGKNA